MVTDPVSVGRPRLELECSWSRCLTVNHVYQGRRDGGRILHPLATRWLEETALAIRQLSAALRITWRPRLRVEVRPYKPTLGRLDGHNLIFLAANAVQAGTGVDDQHFEVFCAAAEHDPVRPRIELILMQLEEVPSVPTSQPHPLRLSPSLRRQSQPPRRRPVRR